MKVKEGEGRGPTSKGRRGRGGWEGKGGGEGRVEGDGQSQTRCYGSEKGNNTTRYGQVCPVEFGI